MVYILPELYESSTPFGMRPSSVLPPGKGKTSLGRAGLERPPAPRLYQEIVSHSVDRMSEVGQIDQLKQCQRPCAAEAELKRHAQI